MAIEVRPADVFDDVRVVIGPKRPDANVCWCLSYRIPSKTRTTARSFCGSQWGLRTRGINWQVR